MALWLHCSTCPGAFICHSEVTLSLSSSGFVGSLGCSLSLASLGTAAPSSSQEVLASPVHITVMAGREQPVCGQTVRKQSAKPAP